MAFNNLAGGTVDVQAGKLALICGGSQAIDFTVAGTATLEFGGNHTFSANSDITGAGNLTFSSGTSTLAGTVNIGGGTATFSGGTTTLNGPFTSGPVTISGGTTTLNGPFTSGPVIISGTAVFNTTLLTTTLTLSGTLSGSGDATVTNSLDWTSGTMSGAGTTTIANGATLTISGGGTKPLSRVIENHGAASWTGGQIQANNGTFNNRSDGTFNAALTATNAWLGTGGTNAFNNEGLFTKTLATSATFQTNSTAVAFNNLAGSTVDVQAGTLALISTFSNFAGTTLTGGTYIVTGIFKFNNANIVTNAATIVLDGLDSQIVNQSNANGIANFATNTAAGSFTLKNGKSLSTGSFSNAGVLAIGPASTFSVSGNYTQSNTGTFSVQLGGAPGSGQFGVLAATGSATLDGALTASLVNGYDPGPVDTFDVLTASPRTSVFAGHNLPVCGSSNCLGLFYKPGAVTLGNCTAGAARTVAGRFVFYNNSFYDSAAAACTTLTGANPCTDNTAIATDKTALNPGQVAGTNNYISFNRGINGLMIDVAQGANCTPLPAGPLAASNFDFKVANSANLGSYIAAAAPLSIDVTPGGGAGGSDRIKIIWANNAIPNIRWLRVVVKSNASGGGIDLDADNIFYFGLAIGDSLTPGTTRVVVSSTDEIDARNHPHNSLSRVPVATNSSYAVANAPDAKFDYDKSSTVSSTDEIVSRNNPANSVSGLLLLNPAP